MQIICKTYLTLRKKGTAREIFDFIQANNFGIANDISYEHVVDYLRRNVHKSHKTGRGCLRNCYDYTKEGHKARVYYIKEK